MWARSSVQRLVFGLSKDFLHMSDMSSALFVGRRSRLGVLVQLLPLGALCRCRPRGHGIAWPRTSAEEGWKDPSGGLDSRVRTCS